MCVCVLCDLAPGGAVVGDRDDDDGRLRRHDAQDVRRHVRRVAVRAHRRTDDRAARPRHRLQLRALLLTHAGARQAPQEAPARPARRGGPAQGAAGRASSRPRASQAARDQRRRAGQAATQRRQKPPRLRRRP